MCGHLEKILTIACEHMVEFVDIALSYTCNGQSVRICDKIRSRRINLAQTVLFRTLPNCPNAGLLHYFSERTRKMAKNVFLAFRPIIWDVATHIQGTTMRNLSSSQLSKCLGLLSTPSCPAWTEKRKSILVKIPNYRWLPKEDPTADEKHQRHNNDTSLNLDW